MLLSRTQTDPIIKTVPSRPEGYRWFPGYTVLGAATVAYIASAPGQTFVVSQLNGPLRETFAISELTLNTSYAIATVMASLPLVLVGRWTDRFGPRKAMAGVALAFGLSCLVLSAVTGFWGVVLAFFLLRFTGQGALTMVSQHATAMWFHRRLGAVHGIKQVVIFAVWIAFPQIALWLINSVGWRQTYVIFAGLVWVGVIPMALLAIRDRPEDLGLRMDGDPADPPEETADEQTSPVARGKARASDEVAFTLGEAIRTPAYWILAAVVFLSPLIGTAFLFDMQPILGQRGMSVESAALVVSSWTAGMAIAAIPAGQMTDRVRPSVLLPAGMGAIGVSALMLWWAPAVWAAAGAMVVFAAGQTLSATASTATIARYFGRTHHGAIRSSLIRIGVVGTGLGPIFTGLSVNRTGGYLASTVAFIVMATVVGMATMSLRPPQPGASN